MIVFTPADMRREMANAGVPHHVYVLRKPDKAAVFGGVGTPFYVGIGSKPDRIFSHEKQARGSTVSSSKLAMIRSIWAEGKEVVRTIDSFHPVVPWHREQELIAEIGTLLAGNGLLTNDQLYAPSALVDGAELRKYASDPSVSDGNSIPAKFKLRGVRLAPGSAKPASTTSVFGKIYATAAQHPNLKGEELIEILKAVDFSGNKSAYTQSGSVSAAWLAGYLEGAVFRNDCLRVVD